MSTKGLGPSLLLAAKLMLNGGYHEKIMANFFGLKRMIFEKINGQVVFQTSLPVVVKCGYGQT